MAKKIFIERLATNIEIDSDKVSVSIAPDTKKNRVHVQVTLHSERNINGQHLFCGINFYGNGGGTLMASMPYDMAIEFMDDFFALLAGDVSA